MYDWIRKIARRVLLVCWSVNALVIADFALASDKAQAPQQFNIPAGSLADALNKLIDQAGVQIMYQPAMTDGIQVSALNGTLTLQEALTQLLANTGLWADAVGERLVVLKRIASSMSDAPADQMRVAQAQSSSSRNTEAKVGMESSKDEAIPEMLVKGSKSLNVDIRRTEGDAQPYVIFDRETLERSGATNLQEFLRQRLTAAVISSTGAQSPASVAGDISSGINLRGLGSGQTLILVDGHRVPDAGYGSAVSQPSITHIPVGAIERVEVLSTTSSGIYGGSATGGVINIILRHDYTGVEMRMAYANTFDSDAAVRTIDMSGGFSLEGGKTDVLLAATWTDANNILQQDRSYVTRGSAAIRANNPTSPTLFSTNPPLGATPNIRSADGSNLVLKSGGALNSPMSSVPVGYRGTATDGGAALFANRGVYNFDLSPDANYLSNALSGGRASLLNAPQRHSLMAMIRREFSSQVQAFMEAAASDSRSHAMNNVSTNSFTIAASAANNPFVQAIRVTIPNSAGDYDNDPVTKSRRVVTGAIVRLPRDWKFAADITWQRDSFRTDGSLSLLAAGSTAIGTGAVDVLRDPALYDLSPYMARQSINDGQHSTLRDGTVRIAGPVFDLRAGPMQLSMMAEHRVTKLSEASVVSLVQGTYTYTPPRSQSVSSVYAETNIPLLPGTFRKDKPRLTAQLAARFDRYVAEAAQLPSALALGAPLPVLDQARNKTSSTDPTAALLYQPVQDVAFRMSYGTGFQPPSVTQLLVQQITVPANFLADPRRGNTLNPTSLSFLSGGNPGLKPELSKSWSAGMIVTPRLIPQLRVSIDYTRIRKTDNIAGATSNGITQVLAAEDQNPGRIIRGANLPGDPAGWAGPIQVLDFTLLNQARAEVDAFDVQADYDFETRWGTLGLNASATRTTRYRTQLTSTSAQDDRLGVGLSNPLKLRANAGLSFTSGQWNWSWFANYFDSYLVSATPLLILDQGNGGKVPSQIYHNTNLSYRFERGAGANNRLLEGVEIQAGVKNVFNRKPPFDAAAILSLYSTLADPLLSNYYLSVKKSL